MTDSKGKDDLPTVEAIGFLAFLTTMLLHELLGHGSICIGSRGHVVLFPVSMQCSIQSRLMVACGPLMNFLAGAGLWFLMRARRFRSVNLRYYLWLTLAFNLFNAAGYLMLGGLASFGDWAVLFGEIQPSWLWRVPAAAIGAGLYYFFMRKVAVAGSEFISNKQTVNHRAHRLTRIPTIVASIGACAAAPYSPFGRQYLLLALGASFGAGIGLLIIHDWGGVTDGRDNPSDLVTRSFVLIALSLIVSYLYVYVVGPGLNIPL